MLPASSSGKNSVARTFSRSRFSYKSIGKSKCRSIMPPACSRSIRSSTDSFSAVIALGRRKPQIRRTPMELKFECPTCGRHLSATPAQIGVTAPCPNCNAAVTVPNTSTLSPSSPPSVQPQSAPATETATTAALADTISGPKRCGFHWLIAGPLSLWCLGWLALNGYNYLYLTWRIFATLKWLSFVG